MINLGTVRSAYIIGSFKNYLKNYERLRKMFWPNEPDKRPIVLITTEDIKLDTTNEEATRNSLTPIVNSMERKYKEAIDIARKEHTGDEVFAEHKADPKILFIIDESDKTASTLARLFQGPWGGFPFAQRTIAFTPPTN